MAVNLLSHLRSALDLSSLEPSLSTISRLNGREILDSRGHPTLEVELYTEGGLQARAAVPSGASTGVHEAHERRDGQSDRFGGKGVKGAVGAVDGELNSALKGLSVLEQQAIDECMKALDGTPNKERLGANAILGVSIAVAKAAADVKGVPLYRHIAELAGHSGPFVLPVPCFNVINGGSHAGNRLPFQEYFIIPVGAATFSEALRIGSESYHALKAIIAERYGGDATAVGDEGGFAPPCDASTGVELIMDALRRAGHEGKCKVGIDVAASEFKLTDEDVYDLGAWHPEGKRTPELKRSSAELARMFAELCDEFPIVTIEDPFDQDDWAAWSKLTAKLGADVQMVGDDLTVTNVKRVRRAIEEGACNALLLKVNQIGTVSEAIAAVQMCKRAGWGVMCSHRSGETEDTSIADLAVGLCTGQIKAGAPCRSERNAKYNQLLRIEEDLGADAIYAGASWRRPIWMAA
eukprot:scaffold136363_cov27-Tisochrysis_lutea.AAC.1